ncbi:GMP/IMP nucleotidase [Porticoccaceae bacterium LTM1]|nr:GMP/IMP nucleotidase [Porticoccaceae bacterium LTM1]
MIDWNAIDTVLLDMDGTLLDLHFDNFFWLDHLPRRYAEHHGVCPDQATKDLHARFDAKRGSLEWYCLEYWSNELSLDICQLKEEVNHLIQERPFVQEFLRELGDSGKQRVLITNAHPGSLSLKLRITGIDQLLDTVISSHRYGAPKEEQSFWQQLHSELQFNPERTLFIDDTERILTSAKEFGIKHLLCITQPDSKMAPRTIEHYPAVTHFDEVLPVTG